MTTVTIPTTLVPAITTNRYVRNGMHPDGMFQGALAQDTDQILFSRLKELANFSCHLDAIPATAGASRDRWRFVFRTSSHCRRIWATMLIGVQPVDKQSDPYGRLSVYTTANVLVGTADFHFGTQPGSNYPSNYGHATVAVMSAGAIVEFTPNTEYYGVFSDVACSLISAVASESALAADTTNGYVETTYPGLSPILDADRQNITVALRNAWKQNAAKLFTWSANVQTSPVINAATTTQNILDTSITTVSAASPGWTLDLTNRSTVRRTTVPCTFYVYAKLTSAGGDGTVRLYDSTGAVVATVTVTSATASWLSTTVDLPATVAKYDVIVRGGGGILYEVNAYAACLIQYEA